MLAPLLAALLSTGSPAPPPAGPACADRVVIGPTSAPVNVRLYLDPTSPRALDAWLELRRIVGELDGRVSAELVVVRKPDQMWPRTRSPDEDRVRVWVMAAADADQAELGLREVDRLGADMLAAWLARPDQRATLERRVGLKLDDARRGCLTSQLAEQSEQLAHRHLSQLGNSTARPPVLGVVGAAGERLITNDSNLHELRTELALTLQEFASGRPRPLPTPPTPSRPSAAVRDVTRIHGGMNVGGPGRPHHLLVYADGEQDPVLPGTLPAALAFRRDRPEELSIQIVARGRRPEAIALRLRLCAAQHSGLEVEYLHALAGADPAGLDLHAHLDAVAERRKCPALDEGADDRGAHLDGVPASASDIRTLEQRLERELQSGPLRWFWLRAEGR